MRCASGHDMKPSFRTFLIHHGGNGRHSWLSPTFKPIKTLDCILNNYNNKDSHMISLRCPEVWEEGNIMWKKQYNSHQMLCCITQQRPISALAASLLSGHFDRSSK